MVRAMMSDWLNSTSSFCASKSWDREAFGAAQNMRLAEATATMLSRRLDQDLRYSLPNTTARRATSAKRDREISPSRRSNARGASRNGVSRPKVIASRAPDNSSVARYKAVVVLE
eukprot:CAMPEP_0115569906 /NCGR_PEP_ID=MMETSP0271-20121206/105429_1 /TAXON_ID=71861 /ORGANISM="Scrippsiella trochoidea, Strain CCMP3099" /LENGTH=114 /DNA_ID=CAMNT_0003004435 /DNA_START=86 /DNA_END=433 /DNA_ORIENTATION=-